MTPDEITAFAKRVLEDFQRIGRNIESMTLDELRGALGEIPAIRAVLQSQLTALDGVEEMVKLTVAYREREAEKALTN